MARTPVASYSTARSSSSDAALKTAGARPALSEPERSERRPRAAAAPIFFRRGRARAPIRLLLQSRSPRRAEFRREVMPFRPHLLIAAVVFCAGLCAAQTPQPPPERSHVERFSTIETRAERVESDAGKKLAADPADAAALNSRGVARLFLGPYKEAAEDLARASALKPDNPDYKANLGSAFWKVGRLDEAVASERAAVKLDDKNYSA